MQAAVTPSHRGRVRYAVTANNGTRCVGRFHNPHPAAFAATLPRGRVQAAELLSEIERREIRWCETRALPANPDLSASPETWR